MTTHDQRDGSSQTDLEEIEWLRVFRDAIESAYDSVLITDARLDPPGPRIVYANPAFRTMTQYEPDEVIGESPRILQGPKTDRSTLAWIRERLESGESFEAQVINYRKDGSTFLIEWRITPVFHGDQISYYVGMQRDVTERERMLGILREQAEVDALTGLYNRREGREIVAVEIERAQRYGPAVSVAILDIDRFKRVNDRHGHGTGDELLSRLGNLLRGRLRTNDRVARWGGEEFLLVLPHTTAYCAGEACEGIRRAVEQVIFTQGIRITASFGIAEYRTDETLDDLIDRADQALYEAKTAGRNQVASARN